MKRRILYLLHLPPPVHGSSMVGKYIKESEIINKGIDSNYVNLLASESVNDSGKVTFKKLLAFIDTFFTLIGKCISFRPQLCYFALSTTGAAFLKDSLLVLILKKIRIPIVYHLHNKGVNNYAHKKLYNRLYKFVFKDTKVILLSTNLYPDIKEFVKEKDTEICPNGIPDVNPNNVNNQRRQIQFLFLSNLIESKGVYILLKACEILKEKKYKFILNIVGGEGDITEDILISKIKKIGIAEEVNYLGKKYGEEKDAIFRSSDVFVFPTFYENECFPLVILEAMRYNLPVISCNEGGISDIVEEGKTGFIVPQRNAEKLAYAMLRFIEQPLLIKELGVAGRRKFEKLYTLPVFEERLKNILQKHVKGDL